MKKLLLLVLFTGFVPGSADAQKQQRKVLLQQIAALKVYSDYAQKGYSIVQKGLHAVGDFKRGEFILHTDYLNALGKVGPAIKKYSAVAEIIVLQAKITSNCQRTCGHLKEGDLFHGSEIAYIKRVFERLLDNCDATLEELIAVTMEGKLEMKDDERMQRIDGLYLNMMANYSFCQSFSNQAELLYTSRTKERKEVQTTAAAYGILNP